MPKQRLPTPEAFEVFSKELLRRNFYKTSARELCERFPRLRLIAPRKIEGSEVGFRFFENDLEVVIWTTWLEKAQRARATDAGWVIILDEKMDVCYSSRPLHRTRNFLTNLLIQACIARARVLHRPRCVECGHFMKLVHGRGVKATYWRCARRLDHKGGAARSVPFDYGLPQEALDYLVKRRRAHRKALRNLRAQGKSPFVAMRQRKRWKRVML